MKVKSLSCVRLFTTPWTAAYRAPPSMGFSRQEYWSGVDNSGDYQDLLYIKEYKKPPIGTSLAVQWLRLHLPMQGVLVKPVVGELSLHMPCGYKTKIY